MSLLHILPIMIFSVELGANNYFSFSSSEILNNLSNS